MKAPKTPPAPAAPDPMVTAQAQTGMNRDTAITQSQLNMIDQYTPDGSLTYKPSGFNTFTDSRGKQVSTPRYTATQTLSPDQQRLNDVNNATQEKIGQIGLDQSNRIGDLLGKPIDLGMGKTFGLPKELDFGAPLDLGKFSYADSPGMGQPLDLGKFGYGDLPGLDNTAVEGRLVDLGRRRLDPMFAQQDETVRTRLKNSGIQQGSEAWDREMAQQGQRQNDAYNSLLLQGRGQAASEALNARQQLGGEQLSAFTTNAQNALAQRQQQGQEALSQFTTNTGNAISQRNIADQEAQNASQVNFDQGLRQRQQSVQEALTQRNQPINEISALMSGSQVSQPQFTNTPQSNVAGVDYSGLVQNNYAQQMAQWNAQNQQRQSQNNAMMGGLFGIGAAAAPFMFSDRRLKRNIERVGTMQNGLPLYQFDYIWGGPRQTGVMGDEVLAVRPDAVSVVDGFLAVDYSALGD